MIATHSRGWLSVSISSVIVCSSTRDPEPGEDRSRLREIYGKTRQEHETGWLAGVQQACAHVR